MTDEDADPGSDELAQSEVLTETALRDLDPMHALSSVVLPHASQSHCVFTVDANGKSAWNTISVPTANASVAPTAGISSQDGGVCVISANDVVIRPTNETQGGLSLTDEIEKINLRIDQMDEKQEIMLDRLDELLGLLKGSKKG